MALVALFVLTLLGMPACNSRPVQAPNAPDQAPPQSPAPSTPGGVAQHLVIGAGGRPEALQVSIEDEVDQAARLFGPRTRILFGGGAGFAGVQEVAPVQSSDPVREQLADLFDPRPGRDMRYRVTRLKVDGPATRDRMLAEIEAATRHGDDLLVYVAGHGQLGDSPRNAAIDLWGGAPLVAADLAAVLDRSPGGRVRLIITTCFSGGFADVIFAAADPTHGIAARNTCGLFAAPWDLEAEGCDPDPTAGRHESYGVHFLAALNHGAASLSEAHAQVRMLSAAADVPTSTSERWLREAAAKDGPSAAVELPEEQAVVTALVARLGLVGRLDEAARHLEALEATAGDLGERLDAAQEELDKVAQRAGAVLLARWPVLDDAWHPRFASTYAQARPALREFFMHAADYLAYQQANTLVQELDERQWAVRVEAAPYERLVRALDNQRLAGILKAAGGEKWRVYQRLRTCEQSLP